MNYFRIWDSWVQDGLKISLFLGALWKKINILPTGDVKM